MVFESFKTMISFAGNVDKNCEFPAYECLEENKVKNKPE